MGADRPFLSFYTPTYKRPRLLARCRASVGAQTIPCEQVVIPDEIGIGIDGMYAALPSHAHKLTGQYVHFLADDDFLAGVDVAERVQRVAQAESLPDVIVVRAIKNGLDLPLESYGPPVEGRIDLGCIITRRDVWLAHVHDYPPLRRRLRPRFTHVAGRAPVCLHGYKAPLP